MYKKIIKNSRLK